MEPLGHPVLTLVPLSSNPSLLWATNQDTLQVIASILGQHTRLASDDHSDCPPSKRPNEPHVGTQKVAKLMPQQFNSMVHSKLNKLNLDPTCDIQTA
eukprot:1913218-Amphidinium_carterae.2